MAFRYCVCLASASKDLKITNAIDQSNKAVKTNTITIYEWIYLATIPKTCLVQNVETRI